MRKTAIALAALGLAATPAAQAKPVAQLSREGLMSTSAPKPRAGMLTGKITGLPKRPGKAKRTLTLRVLRLETRAVAQAVRLRRARFNLKLPAGVYILAVRSFDLPGRTVAATSRLVVVKRGRKVSQNVSLRKRT